MSYGRGRGGEVGGKSACAMLALIFAVTMPVFPASSNASNHYPFTSLVLASRRSLFLGTRIAALSITMLPCAMLSQGMISNLEMCLPRIEHSHAACAIADALHPHLLSNHM